ncbi:MAG: glutamate--cysteine ligase [Actinocatenispora sp.]
MPPLSLGVEEEFLLIGRDGQIATGGPEVAHGVPDSSGQTEQELMRCQVEAATGVHTRLPELIAELAALRTRLAAEADRRGLRLLPSGTSPQPVGKLVVSPDRRYRRIVRKFGELGSSLTCACHVHVGIADRAEGLRISNTIRPWLPVLLAVTANSPYHDGADTRHASWRHMLWSRWPSAGAPPHFTSDDHYDSLVDGLWRCGAILDRGMLYWDIRLSEHEPTVEIRIADVAATVEEAGLLAALIRALASRARARDEIGAGDVVPPEVLRAQLWRTAHDGLSGRCVDPLTGSVAPTVRVARTLVEHVRPQLAEVGDDGFVRRTLDRLAAGGDGATRQRAAYARRRRFTDVVDDLAWPTRVPGHDRSA